MSVSMLFAVSFVNSLAYIAIIILSVANHLHSTKRSFVVVRSPFILCLYTVPNTKRKFICSDRIHGYPLFNSHINALLMLMWPNSKMRCLKLNAK